MADANLKISALQVDSASDYVVCRAFLFEILVIQIRWDRSEMRRGAR